jgi:hypothetical protein
MYHNIPAKIGGESLFLRKLFKAVLKMAMTANDPLLPFTANSKYIF